MQKETLKEDLLTLKDALLVLGVTPQTLQQWIETGLLRSTRVKGEFRFLPADLREAFDRQSNPSFLKKRILVIDDDPLVGESLKHLLEKAGYWAVILTVGLAALDVVSREAFDLIIADVRMPGMGGLETLRAIRELRSQFGYPPIQEIIMTAYDDAPVREEAKRMRVRDFVLKPFELDEFMKLLKERLKIKNGTSREKVSR